MAQSKRWRLNREDCKRILRNVLIIYSPVILLFLDQIQSGAFNYTILIALGVSITIDAIRRFVTDYTKK